MNILSKIAFIFSNLENLKSYVIQIYVFLTKIKPALQKVDDNIPAGTKVQSGIDKIFPTLNKVIDRVIDYIKLIASFVKIELPLIQASANSDPFVELEKLVK